MAQGISKVNIIQINLQHAKASTSLLTADLAQMHTPLALIQEPYVHNGKIIGFEQLKNTTLIYDTSHKRPRACVVISNSMVFHYLPQFTNQDMVAIKIKFSHLTVKRFSVIASVYLPFEKSDPVSDSLKQLADFCSTHKMPLFVGCDSNSHNTVWGSTNTNDRGVKLLDFLVANRLDVLNSGNEPTFSTPQRSEVLDITIASQEAAHFVYNWHVSPIESLSDHKRILFELKNPTITVQEFRNPRKIDYLTLNIEITKSLADLEAIICNNDPCAEEINSLASLLQTTLNDALSVSCPISRAPNGKNCKSWWNKSLSKLKTECRSAHRRARRLPCYHPQYAERWEQYREKRREYKKVINETKDKSWQNFCTEIDSLSATAKLHKLLCKDNSNKLSWLTNSAGLKSQSPSETLTILFDEHFPDTDPTHVPNIPEASNYQTSQACKSPVDPTLLQEIITHEKIYLAFNSFSPYKSPGPDGIFPIVIQKSLYLIIDIIHYLYFHCIKLSYIPETWRHVKVIFIPKAGKTSYTNPKSFRPISLSSYFLKGLERLIDWHIRIDCLSKKPLSISQHAYLTSKSTDSALNDLVTNIEKLRSKNLQVLCCFIDIQGAFDHTSPSIVLKALQRHNISPMIRLWIFNMLQFRIIHSELSDATQEKKIYSGCPQGGVVSPVLWNMVVNELLVLLNSSGIWAQGYADDIVICTTGRELLTASELMQNALSKVERWCKNVGLSVNPNKAETMLFTNKRLVSMCPLTLFKKPIPLKSKVKYLGVHIDNKLNWKNHIETKINKCTGLLLQCNRVTGVKWGVHPRYIFWIFNAIIKPIFLHGVIVWWKFSEPDDNQRYLSRLNRLASSIMTNAFKTTPTAALEYLLDLPPIHLTIQMAALNTCYRLLVNKLWDMKFKDGHNSIIQTLISISPEALMFPDSIPRCLSFGMTHVKFVIPDREQWIERQIQTDFDVNIFTDGSKTDLGTGAGVYINCPSNIPFIEDVRDYQILGKAATIFQAEITAIANAITIVSHLTGLSITFYVDSQAAIHALKANLNVSNIVMNCKHTLSKLAQANNVTVIWVPGHTGIQGNEEADLLANTGSAHEFCGPEPALPIAKSVVKKSIRDWVTESKELYWRNIKYAKHTKAFIIEINLNFDIPLLSFERSLISNFLAVVTGHGSFKVHLQKLKLAEETDCPKCGQDSDTAFHFLTTCQYYNTARKQTFGSSALKGASKPTRISTSELIRFIRLSERFDKRC